MFLKKIYAKTMYRDRFPNELFYLIMNSRNLENFRLKSTKKLVLRSPSRQNSILRGVDWSEIFCRTCLNTTFGRFLVFFRCISTLLWAITETFFLLIKVPVFGLTLQSKGGSSISTAYSWRKLNYSKDTLILKLPISVISLSLIKSYSDHKILLHTPPTNLKLMRGLWSKSLRSE